ncbi:hypothetical protein K2P96_01930, partial [Patescibacteria group bacterium]|nr:hypothetical protein [Patescibacteria group bacterium]
MRQIELVVRDASSPRLRLLKRFLRKRGVVIIVWSSRSKRGQELLRAALRKAGNERKYPLVTVTDSENGRVLFSLSRPHKTEFPTICDCYN